MLMGGVRVKRLNKGQRIRVRRVLNNIRIPINHMEKNGLKDIFEDELTHLLGLRNTIRAKARALGYDPEEDLTDVNKESYYTEARAKND